MLTKPLIATLLLRAEEQVLVRPNQWGYLYNLIKIQREKDWKFNEFWVTMRNFHVFRPNYLYLAQHGDAFAIRKLLGVTGEIHLSPKIIVVDKVEMVYPNGYNKSWPGICAGNG
ncbi:unnamed protein product [Bursaphelenchus okinawaensis]|uniref:Uncharacterized protein n=1 Tax=Bursaphelenchus okinawaensis TaxID=465554 RepID=A0A811L2X5_9BILA|nr:unnamed protein product [Bursaphelenchus okinawaensis]CAG9115641.1 unnamed protein product [Bursaphelenchus okinawaensis]